jgi:hypothetical protein
MRSAGFHTAQLTYTSKYEHTPNLHADECDSKIGERDGHGNGESYGATARSYGATLRYGSGTKARGYGAAAQGYGATGLGTELRGYGATGPCMKHSLQEF